MVKDWLPEQPLTVAGTIDPASRLIADVEASSRWQGEKVRESQRQVHYDYKNRLEEYDAEN